jgi:AraC-like DNA-binding protein
MNPQHMEKSPDHHCQLLSTPWTDVYGTCIDSSRHYGRHWHAAHGVGLLERGAQSSSSGQGKVEAFAGDVITSNPGEVHDGHPLGESSRRWRMVYLDPGVIASAQAHPGSYPARDVEVARPVIKDVRLRHALQRLFLRLDAWRSEPCRDRVGALACEEALVQVCGRLLDSHATSPRLREERCDVKQVRDRLADELLNPPTLSDMAAMTNLSKYQLLRQFQKIYGVPPHAWLMLQRTERARGLIRNGSSLAQAAASSGFADQSHMNRIFVRQFGFTPGAWQRASSLGAGPCHRFRKSSADALLQ